MRSLFLDACALLGSPKITRRWVFALLALAPTVAMGCSSSSPAESPSNTYDSGIFILPDGAIIGADGAILNEDAGRDGSKSDGGDGGDSGGFTGPPPPGAVCNPSATFNVTAILNISTTGDDALDSVTPDELSIAWTRGTGASAVVYYADRTSLSDNFGTPQSFAAAQYTADRVALSPDGLTLVVVNNDQKGFSELTRAARSDAFGSAALGSFGNINSDTPVGGSIGDPVLDSSNTAFYYSVYGVGAAKTIYRALRLLPTDPWGNGGALNVAAGLQASGANRRRPTGISSDSQTLFFFDQVSGTERAGWVDETTGQIDSFVDLGARLWAAPSTSCANLYYSAAGTSSVDLFVAH